ncbi:Zinc-finger domain of monoamine-oxidase A repressor R1 [Trifolium repens]|nr:Zinc-finger domain of monoamine-oxidase A repressor R1 [Trifolium repens]
MAKMKMRETIKSDYEALRIARISENKARLESLGILNKVSKLREASTPTKKQRTNVKTVYGLTPLRRSQRIKDVAAGTIITATATSDDLPSRRSHRLKISFSNDVVTPKKEKLTTEEGEEEKERRIVTTNKWDEEKRPANAPLIELNPKDVEHFLSAESSGRRCDSKGRGSVYNPVLGICCHFCRQKKLCGEEDCKRCGNCDVDEPCLGKTDCSVCHSSNGVFCRACLKVRYGEEIEEVRENKEWMCPHCIEDKGINPYWICNSSICLRKRKMSPTGIAIHKAREMGYESVAHLLMEELKRGSRHKR